MKRGSFKASNILVTLSLSVHTLDDRESGSVHKVDHFHVNRTRGFHKVDHFHVNGTRGFHKVDHFHVNGTRGFHKVDHFHVNGTRGFRAELSVLVP